jgi:hypothetical protein
MSKRSGSMFGKLSGLFSGKKPLIKQMHDYMEFYYPSKSKVTYNIIFDWGEYIITTEDKETASVHEDSKPYLGYITMRPEVVKQSPDFSPSIYLITPDGEVWENTKGHDISERKSRQEISKEKTKHGVTTKKLTIQSMSEPVIDHYRTNPEKWTRYGKLEIIGNKTKLKLYES